MSVVTASQRRSTTTPNATMTTIASPTLGGSGQSLWWVQMEPYAVGPTHAFAGEVLWAVTEGSAELTVGTDDLELQAGDTAILPGGVMRRFRSGSAGFTAVVTTIAPTEVVREDGTSAGVPPWVA